MPADTHVSEASDFPHSVLLPAVCSTCAMLQAPRTAREGRDVPPTSGRLGLEWVGIAGCRCHGGKAHLLARMRRLGRKVGSQQQSRGEILESRMGDFRVPVAAGFCAPLRSG